MKIPLQPTAIRGQTQLPRALVFACLIAEIAALACNAPDRGPRATAPGPAASANLAPVTAPVAVPASVAAPAPVAVPASVAVPALSSPAAPVATYPAPTPRHYIIAAIGDSLTDPRSHGGGYLEYLKERCPGVEVDNFGKGGTMVNQMRRSFDTQVVSSAKHYTHLVVFGGVNDLYSDLTALRTPAKIEADLSYMYGWAHAHAVQVVAFTVAPWGGFERYFNPSRAATTHELNSWIRAQPAAGRVDHVVDAYALLSCGDPDRLCDRFFTPFKDGLHFGQEGHQALGQALFQSAFSDCE